jgi:uncharacterized protein YqcC (DUF446 family)
MMKDRYGQAGEKIDEVVAEMRRLGVWQDEPPPPEKMRFSKAFAMDTLSFEQWLQFVLVPRVRGIIDERGQFPDDSSLGDKANREYIMWGSDPRFERLVDLLFELDSFVRLFRMTVRDFYLFEADASPPPFGSRPLRASRFARAETRFVYWELVLDFPDLYRRVPLDIEAVYRDGRGSLLVRQTLKAGIEAGWTWSNHFHSWGWNEPGRWEPGPYTLELFAWNEKIAAAPFEIF